MDRSIVEVEFPNGATALVEAVDARGGAVKAGRAGKSDLSAVDRASSPAHGNRGGTTPA